MDRHEDTKTRRKESLFLIWCFRGVTARRTPGSLFVASCLRGLPILALLAISCSAPKPPDDRDYATRIAADRAAKDEAFTASNDPIPKAKHAEFLPLAYYPVDPEFNVPAELKRIDDPTIIEMPTSTGTNRKMRRVGTLHFTLKGQPLSLLAFIELGETSSLFVAFSDLTSGAETYTAGRFLDINRNATGLYELDFNRAYFPYCYYNPTYECPLPPRENRLKIPIHAGERMKKFEVGSLK
jgi:uncharacterized protein (DUF1684 family)